MSQPCFQLEQSFTEFFVGPRVDFLQKKNLNAPTVAGTPGGCNLYKIPDATAYSLCRTTGQAGTFAADTGFAHHFYKTLQTKKHLNWCWNLVKICQY